MSIFGRTFAVEKITGQVLAENPWLKDMLLDWRPAGDAVYRDMTDAHKCVSSGQCWRRIQTPASGDPQRVSQSLSGWPVRRKNRLR